MGEITFKPPGPVSRAFMRSNAFVRGLRGPVGSAKSSTCTMECLRRMMGQEPDAKSMRRTRGAIIRNTNPMLRTTTLNTYKEWIPEETFGHIKMHPPPFEQEVDILLPDRTRLVAEVYFLALDSPDDMKKLLSLELTWAWGNEAREFNKLIVDGITQRLRRFPAVKDGGATWSGLWMDTNSPDDDHWWGIMAGECPPPEDMSEDELRKLVKPANWEFFTQPPAMLEQRKVDGSIDYVVNPEAENLANLDKDYYPGQLEGKTKQYIDVYLLNRYGATHDGRAVQPDFNKELHVSKTPLSPWPGVPIQVSADFGLTPAAALYQRLRGRRQTLAEVVISDGGAVKLAAACNAVMRERFPGFKYGPSWGDPAGDTRSQADEKTPFQIMRAAGIPMRPCDTNDPEIRRAAGRAVLTKLDGGRPVEIIDPSCKVLIAGLDGAWYYKRVQGAGNVFQDEPLKNRYSHICEGWEYGPLGDGEARHLLGLKPRQTVKPVNVRGQADPMARFNQQRYSRGASFGAWRGDPRRR